jgi:glycine cleavage system H protein
MAVVEKFLGRRIEIPEDCRYAIKQGLWARCLDETIVFGLTEPGLVLSGGIKDIEWLVDEDKTVAANEAVAFAITGKIQYIDTPVAGKVQFNRIVRANPNQIASDPYGQGWLFLIRPQADMDRLYHALPSWETYLESLRYTEGFKNPEGKKGGVSGICKAVYIGIGEQKI